MRDSESTLRRRAVSPQRLSAGYWRKNRQGVSERGSETAILATGGEGTARIKTRFRGAHTGQRWPLR
jgi:hypothetical protein